MKIVSVNAWGGAMFDAFAAWLPRCDADIVCLQEVTRTAGQHGWTRFEDSERTLPQRANLFDDVVSALPNHQAMFVTSDAGPVAVEGRAEFGPRRFLGVVTLHEVEASAQCIERSGVGVLDRALDRFACVPAEVVVAPTNAVIDQGAASFLGQRALLMVEP